MLAALPGARAVGGCVRDALAGRDSADVDVGAPFPPEEIATRLRDAGLKVFETGLAHGTITAVKDHLPVEVTSLRRDVLTDGRHAVVEWTTDWREDAARRDFTINAMSLTAEGALFDYFTGRADLAAGKVRFVGDPDTRLAEDYLRALRFFRFQARYGAGKPDAAAVAAIARAVPGLALLSIERVWMELKRILAVPDPRAALDLMAQTGVLGAVLPEAGARDILMRLIESGAPADALLRLAALLAAGTDTAALARRLRFSAEERSWLDEIRGGQGPVAPGAADADLRRALAHADRTRLGAPARLVLLRTWLSQARQDGASAPWDKLRARIEAIVAAGIPTFPLLGRDLAGEGIAPGPAMGRWLAELRAWWLSGGCIATREDCLAELRRRLAQGGGGTALGG
ncbi:CCA tRNA nucleotidyltransferase [Roseomonas soli]|uniref:CCA tRNA nucleotidyltransferase n=1 Tax=Neoroseomonas soli TaxID=1081025 RepID=A0A9X9X3K7_9PROT|nr:CCA tRNA nucleotidyltransferase [Neoroseomonas soli]